MDTFTRELINIQVRQSLKKIREERELKIFNEIAQWLIDLQQNKPMQKHVKDKRQLKFYIDVFDENYPLFKDIDYKEKTKLLYEIMGLVVDPEEVRIVILKG